MLQFLSVKILFLSNWNICCIVSIEFTFKFPLWISCVCTGPEMCSMPPIISRSSRHTKGFPTAFFNVDHFEIVHIQCWTNTQRPFKLHSSLSSILYSIMQQHWDWSFLFSSLRHIIWYFKLVRCRFESHLYTSSFTAVFCRIIAAIRIFKFTADTIITRFARRRKNGC